MTTKIDHEARTIDQAGPAYERGVEHGRELKDEIAALIEDVCPPEWRQAPTVAERIERELASLERFGGPHHVAELRGIAAGSGIPFDDLARLNLIVGTDGVPGVESQAGTYRPACSAIVLTDPDLGAVCGKNGDAEAHQGRWYWTQWVDGSADGLPRYLNVIWPGTVWSDSGVNEFGLAVVQTAGPGMLGQGPGLASCVYPRMILERARTVAEAIELLRTVPASGCGLVYALADAGGDTAIVEKVHDRMAVRDRGTSYAWAVNDFEVPEMRAISAPIAFDGIDESNAARCTGFAALSDPPGTRDELIAALRTPPIFQSGAGGLYSVHSAVYTAADRSLLIAGDAQAAPFAYRTLDPARA